MRNQIVAIFCLIVTSSWGNEPEAILKIDQIDLSRHLAAVKIEGNEEYKEFFVESEKGEQCSLPVKGQTEGILFLRTEDCFFEKKIKAGQLLKPSLFGNISSPEKKIETKAEVISPAGYEITWKALSYSRTKIDAEVEGYIKGSYELTQSDFKTLPLDFEIDIKGESFGLLLEPVSDESTVGGTISPYLKFPLFDLGISASYLVNKKSEKLIIDTSTQTSEAKSEIFSIGAFLRKVVTSPNNKIDFKLSFGYIKNTNRADDDKVIVDYFGGGIDLSTYFQVRKGLYIGPSIGFFVADGSISWENSTDKLGSDTDVFTFSISPLVMNFEF